MEVTGVRVTLIRGKKQKVRAFCTVTFDESFVVIEQKQDMLVFGPEHPRPAHAVSGGEPVLRWD